MPYCLNLHLFRKVMILELDHSVSLKADCECQLRCGGGLPLLLPTVVSLPSGLRGGRASGCGCVEMSALSEMTTSVSKRTEQSWPPQPLALLLRLPLGLWVCANSWARSVLVLLAACGLHGDGHWLSHRLSVSPGLRLSCWYTSRKGSVFYTSLQSCCIPVSN